MLGDEGGGCLGGVAPRGAQGCPSHELQSKGERGVGRGGDSLRGNAELPATRLHELASPLVPSVAGWVVGVINLAVLSRLFVLREIEASLILRRTVILTPWR